MRSNARVQQTETGWDVVGPTGTMRTFETRRKAREFVRSLNHTEDYPGQVIDGPEVTEEPAPAPEPVDDRGPDWTPWVEPVAETPVPEVAPTPAETPAETPAPEAPAPTPAAKPAGFILKVGGDYLRRDQPRKPGDTAHYKLVAWDRATVYKSQRMAEVKRAEALGLADNTFAQVDIEEVR